MENQPANRTKTFARKAAVWVGKAFAACTWWGLALWTTLAVYFTLCDRFWLAALLAALVAGIYVAGIYVAGIYVAGIYVAGIYVAACSGDRSTSTAATPSPLRPATASPNPSPSMAPAAKWSSMANRFR